MTIAEGLIVTHWKNAAYYEFKLLDVHMVLRAGMRVFPCRRVVCQWHDFIPDIIRMQALPVYTAIAIT